MVFVLFIVLLVVCSVLVICVFGVRVMSFGVCIRLIMLIIIGRLEWFGEFGFVDDLGFVGEIGFIGGSLVDIIGLVWLWIKVNIVISIVRVVIIVNVMVLVWFGFVCILFV